jgi:glycosyltransferase involved in cell wall biosynthesis
MKLSIITINYNNLEGLRLTMQSVLEQQCRQFEYIVIDGASTDGSAEFVRSHATNLSYWVSEPDGGIYSAMNKGVRAATGDYVLMLNSGDFLVDNQVIERILPELDGTDIVQGNIVEQRADGLWRNRGYGRSNITFFDVMKCHFLHQAAFCRRSLFSQYGEFDESFRIIGDSVFFVKCLGFGNASFRYVDIDVANYDMHGVSAATSGPTHDVYLADVDRYNQLFPQRLRQQLADDDKKIRLYDQLHSNRFIWLLVVGITHLSNLFYKTRKCTEKIKC